MLTRRSGAAESPAGCILDDLFATETMAELSARQGRVADAVAIFRHLVGAAAGANDGVSEGASVERWKARIAELEGGDAAGAAAPSVGVPARPPAPPARS